MVTTNNIIMLIIIYCYYYAAIIIKSLLGKIYISKQNIKKLPFVYTLNTM